MASRQFMTNNLDLLGFQPGNILLQTLKELIDNSIDACNAKSAYPGSKAKASLQLLFEKSGNKIKVIARDNGIGMANPVQYLQGFRSDTNNTITRIGKFGVGLASSCYYSWKSTGKCIVIASKRSEARTGLVQVIDFEELSSDNDSGSNSGSNGNQDPRVIHREDYDQIDDDHDSGSIIELYINTSDVDIKKELKMFMKYMQLMAFDSQLPLQLELKQKIYSATGVAEDKDDVATTSTSSISKRQYQQWMNNQNLQQQTTNATISISSSTSQTRSTQKKRRRRTVPAAMKKRSCQEIEVLRYGHNNNPSSGLATTNAATVTATSRTPTAVSEITAKGSSSILEVIGCVFLTEDAAAVPTPSTSEIAIPLTLWKFINGKPMTAMTTADDGDPAAMNSHCLLSKTIRACLVRANAGHHPMMKISDHHHTAAPTTAVIAHSSQEYSQMELDGDEEEEDNGDDEDETEDEEEQQQHADDGDIFMMTKPSFVISTKRSMSSSSSSSATSLITAQAKELARRSSMLLIVKYNTVIKTCLSRLVQSALLSQIFINADNYLASYANTVAIPSLTKSLMTIINYSQSEELHRWVRRKLDLGILDREGERDDEENEQMSNRLRELLEEAILWRNDHPTITQMEDG